MLRTIYFDLGNVLVFFSFPKMIRQMAACTGLAETEIQKLLLEKNYRDTYETGKIGSQQLYDAFRSFSPKTYSFAALMDSISDIFTPNLALWPLVDQLKQAGLRLVLLSNTSECHIQRISSDYPILSRFDHKILSYEVGACKPDPLIYQKALAVSQCRPEECFYTDDIPEFIEGARRSGLDGEIYTDVPSLRRHLIARGCHFLI